MQVRPATRADVEAVYDLHVASIRAFGPSAYDEQQVTAWAETEFQGIDDHYPVAEPGHQFVVATRAGELAGFGHLAVEEREIQAVYVHPDHARAGVGSALLAHLEGAAYGLDLPELELTASLNAVPFYREAGYERVAETVHHTSAPPPGGADSRAGSEATREASGGGIEAELDVVVMRKELSPAEEL
jgi:putative acetyltransferase